MLNVNTVINPDDYVGTVRRTLKRAVRKQLRGAEAVAAYAQCRKIAGGTVVRRPPAGATALRYRDGGFVIPVDKDDNLVLV